MLDGNVYPRLDRPFLVLLFGGQVIRVVGFWVFI